MRRLILIPSCLVVGLCAVPSLAADKIDKLARECAAGKTKACENLARIAKTDSEWGTRSTATKQLTDQAILAEIARNDKEKYVREAAVGKLTDQAVLAEIATTDSDADVRVAATGQLTDQTLLAEMAKAGSSAYVRVAATGKLTDQTLLADIAKTDRDDPVRESAVKRLTDQTVLAEIAKANSRWVARLSAFKKLRRDTPGRPVWATAIQGLVVVQLHNPNAYALIEGGEIEAAPSDRIQMNGGRIVKCVLATTGPVDVEQVANRLLPKYADRFSPASDFSLVRGVAGGLFFHRGGASAKVLTFGSNSGAVVCTYDFPGGRTLDGVLRGELRSDKDTGEAILVPAVTSEVDRHPVSIPVRDLDTCGSGGKKDY